MSGVIAYNLNSKIGYRWHNSVQFILVHSDSIKFALIWSAMTFSSNSSSDVYENWKKKSEIKPHRNDWGLEIGQNPAVFGALKLNDISSQRHHSNFEWIMRRWTIKCSSSVWCDLSCRNCDLSYWFFLNSSTSCLVMSSAMVNGIFLFQLSFMSTPFAQPI